MSKHNSIQKKVEKLFTRIEKAKIDFANQQNDGLRTPGSSMIKKYISQFTKTLISQLRRVNLLRKLLEAKDAPTLCMKILMFHQTHSD